MKHVGTVGSAQPGHPVCFSESITIILLSPKRPVVLVRSGPMSVRIYATQLVPQSTEQQSEPFEQIGLVTDVLSPNQSFCMHNHDPFGNRR